MDTLPSRPRRRHNDPQLPKGRKKLGSTIFVSGLAVMIVLFAKGDLPQIDLFFKQLNEIIQSHNDEAVQGMLHYGPLLLVSLGVIGAVFMARSSFRNRRRSA